jgi:hypothetical protein
MKDKQELQQIAYRKYLAQCKPYLTTLHAEACMCEDDTSRSAVVQKYLDATQLFYDEYNAYLRSIEYNNFTISGE